MNQTKKRALCTLAETDMHLPGWNQKQRHDFFEGIRIHGLKKLKKLTRHISTKTQEDVRIATELYKKEVRNRELTTDMERQIEEAGVSTEDYKTWLYFYMASQSHRGDVLPMAALEAFLEQTAPRLRSARELTFPGWRRAEIKDFLATIELTRVITNTARHIPTKTDLEITAANDAYNIICDARNDAIENGLRVPGFDELKPGYVYLQCIVAALNDHDKLKKFKIPPTADPDMAKAQFVLKEWLMPDVGILQNGWTKDEKYALIVAIEAYGQFDILRIQSILSWKTRADLKSAIAAIKKEYEFKESCYVKSRSDRYLSLTSWGSTLILCKENKHKIAAAKRLIFALEELPEPTSRLGFMQVFRPDMTEDEMTAAVLNLCMQDAQEKGARLVPLLELLIVGAQAELRRDAERRKANKQAQQRNEDMRQAQQRDVEMRQAQQQLQRLAEMRRARQLIQRDSQRRHAKQLQRDAEMRKANQQLQRDADMPQANEEPQRDGEKRRATRKLPRKVEKRQAIQEAQRT